jgi:hypothetical protein
MAKSKMAGDNSWVNLETGKLHRLDGPALTSTAGTKHWYIDGKRHRVDGPAVVWYNCDYEWWVDGKRLTQEEFDRHPLVVFAALSKGF